MRGDIPLDLLLNAYAQGAFPMADTADDPEISWIRPHVRAVLPLTPLRVPTRLARKIRSSPWRVTVDAAFPEVIAACGELTEGRQETWINAAIRRAFVDLNERGMTHSVEVWDDDRLVGGLYGLRLGGAFFGESMFSRATDASKIALVHLAARLTRAGFGLLDAQFENPHLNQFGARLEPHGAYMRTLAVAMTLTPDMSTFHAPMSGADAVSAAAAHHPGVVDRMLQAADAGT